ncbi:MAG: sulfatase-like hydrolase/transferase [Planctomycetota bacterium]
MRRLILIFFVLFAVPALAEKPNIIFIMVDDFGKEWVSSYGAEGIETPNIDKLTADGMRFENAWCMPQCTPTRVTLLTGQYPFRHGWTNHWDVPRWGAGAHFDPGLNPSFPLVLRDAGYKTAAAGKWQIDDFRVEPRAMDEAGFDQWCMWTGYETGVKASARRYADPYLATNGTSKTHPGKYGPDVFCEFLLGFMREHKDDPMFVYFPMVLTHGPFDPTPDAPDVTDRAEAFRQMVLYMDKLVGKLARELETLGIADKTYLIFTADNGSPGFKNHRNGQVVPGGKTKMSENGTAVPFIVIGPGIKPGSTTQALIDFTDLAPTFTALAGTTMPGDHVIDGRSFAPLLQGKADDSSRQWIMSMGGHPAKLREGRVVPKEPYDERVLRDKRFKVWVDGDGEITRLHDMVEDPWEQTNLLQSGQLTPEHQAAIAKFKAVLATFPQTDTAPAYRTNPAQHWDRKK